MKRKILIGLSVMALVTIFTVGTSFADWLFNVNLVKSEASTTGTMISVADDGGTVLAQKFLATEIEKSGLSVALTAQAMSQKVHVFVDTGLDKITGIVLSTE